MIKKSLLILVNNYFNSPEINEYIEQLDTLEKKNISISVIINDNTGEFKQTVKVNTIDTYSIAASCNLGYIGGCSNGYDYWIHTLNKPSPEWIMISNTDLILPKNFLTLLNKTKSTVGVLSPVVINSNKNYQNPHVITRISTKNIKKYLIIFSNPVFSFLYLISSAIKSKLPNNKRRLTSSEGILSVYAAHGSIFFITKYFFEKGGTISGGPFLYGEEFFVAEQNYRLKLSSIIDLSITVIHNEHSTTSAISLFRKRKLLLNSYKMIYKELLKTEELSNETNLTKHGLRRN